MFVGKFSNWINAAQHARYFALRLFAVSVRDRRYVLSAHW